MDSALAAFLPHSNNTRYHAQPSGHYESFFLRANHPSRPLAFWIRYTLFSPKQHPEAAVGELWAVFFNGETNNHVAVKQVFPLADCSFSPSAFQVQIAQARLQQGQLHGAIRQDDAALAWDLTYDSPAPPVLLLPLRRYATKLPQAKSLVGAPMASYQGKLVINDEQVAVDDWVGSQNHNWGSKHTDRYAWGQVAGFDTHPDSFLEIATARLKVGPAWIPPLTLLVLRHAGTTWSLNTLLQSWRAQGEFAVGRWTFRSQTRDIEIAGTIAAPATAFVGLRYANPPGGIKDCLNTKIASCALTITHKRTGQRETLMTSHRAAFEILTDVQQHGIPISS